MGRIAYHTFAVQLPDYTTVLSLDRELLSWQDSLPSFFSMTNPDTSLDKEYPYLFVQRHLLACEWYYTRITLNRPYLLRRRPQDGRYAYSKTAAIESATADLLNRRAFVLAEGHLVINSGGYRVLNSYMVIGVTIKLDPQSPQADELRNLLNVVSGRSPDTNGVISEPLVKEELAIVEFLTAKSTPAMSKQPSHERMTRGDDQTPVDLLLGLAKTRSGKRAAEEEKRQLRLQQQMEVEEQQATAQPNGAGMSSPWGYVAPSMPGLEVQQPFGANGSRRAPRPLQPPPSRKNQDRGYQSLQPSVVGQPTPTRPEQPFDFSHPLDNMSNDSQQQQTFDPFANLTPATDQPSAGFTTSMPNQSDFGAMQFGQGNMDAFDFTNFGLEVTPPTGNEAASFNPFALAQNHFLEEG